MLGSFVCMLGAVYVLEAYDVKRTVAEELLIAFVASMAIVALTAIEKRLENFEFGGPTSARRVEVIGPFARSKTWPPSIPNRPCG